MNNEIVSQDKKVEQIDRKNSRSFAFGLLSGYTVFVITTIGSIYLIPHVLSYLTKDEYGAYTLLIEIFGWLIVTDLGVVAVFNSKGAHLNGQSMKSELNDWFNTVFFAHIFSALIPIAILALFLFKWQLFLGEDVEKVDGIRALITLLSISFVLDYISRPLRSLLLIRKQIFKINLLDLFFFVLRFTLILLCLYFNYNILSFGIASLVSRTLTTILTILLTRRDLRDLGPRNFKVSLLKYLFGNGLWISVGGLAGILILRTDSILINRYLSLSLVGTYFINRRLWDYAEKVHSKYLDNYRPFMSNLYGQETKHRFNDIGRNMYRVSLVISLAIGATVYFLSKIFIYFLVGSEYYLGGVISALFFAQYLIQSNVLPTRIILATSLYKVSKHNMTRISEGILKVALSILMLSEFGLQGLIVSSILSSLCCSHIILGRYIRELIALNRVYVRVAVGIGLILTLSLAAFPMYERYIVTTFLLTTVLFLWRIFQNSNLTIKGLLSIE